MTDAERARVLDAFDRAVAREIHHLTRRPVLLSQQLLNTLRFVAPPLEVIEEATDRETITPTRPWAKRVNPVRRSSALRFVLESRFPTSCVVGPRGDFIAAGVDDGTMNVWEAESGRQVLSLPITSDGSESKLLGTTLRGEVICLEDRASTLRLRDPQTSEVRSVLNHSTWDVRGCAVTELKSFVLLESRGNELRAWTQEGPAWSVPDEHAIRAASLDESLVASASTDGYVTVREVTWKGYATEPEVTVGSLWQAPSRSASVVACDVRDQLGAVLLAYDDGTLWIGDASTGAEHGTVPAGTKDITSCALGPDFVVVAAGDGTVRVLDLRTLMTRFISELGPVTGCAADREGSMVVAGDRDGIVRILDPTSGATRKTFTAARGSVAACGFSYDGEAALVATVLGCVEAWWHGSDSKWFQWAGPYEVKAGASTPSGDLLVVVTADGCIRLWDTDLASERTLPADVGGPVTCCAVDQTGDLILLGFEDGTIHLVDARGSSSLHRRRAHEGPVRCCAFAPDRGFVASGGADGKLALWGVPELDEILSISAHRAGVSSCAVTPDGRAIVSGPDGPDFGEPARIWDARTGEEVSTLEGQDDSRVPACAVSPDGTFVVTAGWGGNALRVWGVERPEPSSRGPQVPGGRICAFHPDGQRVLTGWHDKVAVADAGSGESLLELQGIVEDDMFAGAISPDGRFYAAAGWKGVVLVWDVLTGKVERTLPPTVGIEEWRDRSSHCVQLAVSPAGDLILSCETEGIRVWNLLTGEEWLIDRDDGFQVTPNGSSIAISVDGKTTFVDIASADPIASTQGGGLATPDWSAFVSYSSGVLRVWDAASGDELSSARVHEESSQKTEVRGAAITPDGRFIVTGANDRTVRVTRLEGLETLMTIPLVASVESVAVHPWRPLVACGDFTKNLHLLELVGIAYGPIVVTPQDLGDGPFIRCPKCRETFPFESQWAEEVIGCPTPDCGLELRITRFVTRRFSGPPSPELQTGERKIAATGLGGAISRTMDDLDRRRAKGGP